MDFRDQQVRDKLNERLVNVLNTECSIVLRLETSGPFKGCWELVSLNTPKSFRRQGHATRAMQQICKDADAVGKSIHLTARPVDSEGLNEVQLRKFYEKFGFENYPGMGRGAMYSMLRKPQH